MTAGRERDDLLTLALALAVVPLTWWLLLGWSTSRALAGHDELALLHNLLSIREIAETREGWWALVYRPDALGGFKGRDTVGPFPLFTVLAAMSATPTTISVWSAFTVQALLGFLGCRAAADLTTVAGGTVRALTPIGRLGVLWLCAFTPALAWRLGFGHLNLVVGLLPFAAALALVAAAGARSVTLTLGALSAAAFVLGPLHAGQQLVVYGAIFGAPILLGLWLSLGGTWRSLASPVLVTVGAFLVALPAFWGVLAHARSSDAARSLGTATVTYDFVTSTLGDWLTSLPWTRALPSPDRAASLHHEVNYPLGPLVVLLVLVPWRRARALAIGLAVAVVAVLVFSMDLAPGSRALLALIPPLRSFRVPGRAAVLLIWALSILSVAALAARAGGSPPPPAAPRATRRQKSRGERRRPVGTPWRDHLVWLGVPLAIVLFLAPPTLRDVAALGLIAASVAVVWRGGVVPVAMILVVLGACSVGAFRERLLPFPEPARHLAEADGLGAAVRRIKPEARLHADPGAAGSRDPRVHRELRVRGRVGQPRRLRHAHATILPARLRAARRPVRADRDLLQAPRRRPGVRRPAAALRRRLERDAACAWSPGGESARTDSRPRVVQRLDRPPGPPWRAGPRSSATPAKRSDGAPPRCCGSTPIRSPLAPTSRRRSTRGVGTHGSSRSLRPAARTRSSPRPRPPPRAR